MGWVGGNEQLPRKENSPGKINDRRKFIQTDLLWHYYSELFLSFYGGSTLFPSIKNPLPFSMHIFFFFSCAPVCAHAQSLLPIPRHRQSLKKRSRKEGGGASSPLDTHAEMPPPSPSLCVSARHRAQRGEGKKSQTKFFSSHDPLKAPPSYLFPLWRRGRVWKGIFARGEKARLWELERVEEKDPLLSSSGLFFEGDAAIEGIDR